MNKVVKIALGIVTLTPFVFAAMLFGSFFLMLRSAPNQGFEEHFSIYIPIVNLVGLIFTVFFTAIWIFYIVHATRNPNLEISGMRTTWIVALVILGAWVMPFYWFHHIWRDGEAPASGGPLGLS